MPRAYGQRGNPWAAAGSQWAPPPRHPASTFRTPQPSNTQKRQSTTSNADRYAEFTASAQRRPTSKKAESAQTWQAWEGMRAGSKNKTSAQGAAAGAASSRASAASSRSASYAAPPPPPVPPRPAPAKQPKGSFGARVQRGGYIPESPGDEPPVTNNNYFTTRTHSNLFSETSEAARARRREPADDGAQVPPSLDPRQSTPYQSHGGEKFDPYIGRSRSTRERNRMSGDNEGNETRAARQRGTSDSGDPDNRPHAAQGGEASSNGYSSMDSANGSPREGHNDDTGSGKARGNLYANSFHYAPRYSTCAFPCAANHMANGMKDEAFFKQETLNLPPEIRVRFDPQAGVNSMSSSEGKSRENGLNSINESLRTPRKNGLNAFDESLRGLINRLSAQKYQRSDQNTPASASNQTSRANQNDNSFGTPVPGESFAADSHRFTRNSTDNINTSFVGEDDPRDWQFNAGSPVGEPGRPVMPRSKSGSSRISRQSSFNPHISQPVFGTTENSEGAAASQHQNGSFNPEDWSEKIGPQIFDPSTAQKASTTRSSRSQSRKPKAVRMTAGTAGLVDSDESSGQDESLKTQPAQGRGHGVDGAVSPNAMDVDPPPTHNNASRNGARNIPVTPSRPEWRAGDVGLGINADPKASTAKQPVGGSEDSEEFRASFADLRNIEPFAECATGLDSFGDMKTNLPFPSAASGHVPSRKPVPRSHKLTLPEPPQAPAAPPALAVQGLTPSAVAWKKYVEAFQTYLAQWQAYSSQFADHFHARKIQTAEKLSNSSWIESLDGTGLQEYMIWMEEDREVRSKWTEACNDHENNVRLFIVHREKMMK